MIYGLDAAYPPKTLAVAKGLYSLGWRFFGGYLGGNLALNAWHNKDFNILWQAGFKFILFHVSYGLGYDAGFQAGLDAAGLAGNCGFNEAQPIYLDAEAGWYENSPGANHQLYVDFCDGWCAALHDIGHPTGLYSDLTTIEAIGSHFDATMCADYVSNVNYQKPPVGRFDPNSDPPTDAWQFDDKGLILGVSVDFDSAVDNILLAEYTPPN